MRARLILLIGQNSLSMEVTAALHGPQPLRLCPDVQSIEQLWDDSVGLLLAVYDWPALSELSSLNRRAAERRIAFMPVWVEFGECWIGPHFHIGAKPGCWECFLARRWNAHEQTRLYREAVRALADRRALDPALSPLTARYIAAFVAARAAEPVDPDLSSSRMHLIELATLRTEMHAFLPLATCPTCGPADSDSSPLPTLALMHPQPTADGGWRVRAVAGERDRYVETYVDSRCGLISTLGVDLTNPLCATGSARLRLGEYHREVWSGGLTPRFEESQVIAIIEALERYAGLRPRFQHRPFKGSHAQVEAAALDPRSLTLYAPCQYASAAFPCVAYREDLEFEWIWGGKFGRSDPVLVPKQLAYYDANQYPKEETFVIETSNGCASGGSIEEAVLYGLLEVIERDAALRTWHGAVSPRRIDLASIRNAELAQIIERMKVVGNCDVYVLDITQEFGIPSIWVMSVRRDDNGPRTMSATKSHPDAIAAVEGALAEISASLLYQERQYAERREALLTMLNDLDRVRDQFDHTLIAGLPEAFPKYEFLLGSSTAVDLGELAWAPAADVKGDIVQTLLAVAQEVVDRNFETYFVNQTAPEQALTNIFTAKVLVPGLVPLSMGHTLRRLHDCARLPGGKVRNEFPHPFP